MTAVPPADERPSFGPLLEQALRVAATHHRTQTRKGANVPYITHPAAMALILQRFGFDDDELIAAALLHDVVEDTDCTIEELVSLFPATVVETVEALSERKLDEQGAKRPWRDRKLEHIEHIRLAPFPARVVALTDKLHNLLSMRFDLEQGEDVWSRFNAPRADVLWYHQEMIQSASQDEPRLGPLSDACHELLRQLRLSDSAADKA